MFCFLVCVTVVYIPLMLFGLLGNILTILVVWLRPHMRSSTYLYLSSMAVSDLLILLLLPLDLYKVHSHTYTQKVSCILLQYTVSFDRMLMFWLKVQSQKLQATHMNEEGGIMHLLPVDDSGLNKPLLPSPQGIPTAKFHFPLLLSEVMSYPECSYITLLSFPLQWQ